LDDSRSRTALVKGKAPDQQAVCNCLAVAKKLGGVLRVPRPKHPGQNPAAAEAFKKDLA
jgi:hypothetical protein